MRKIGPTICVIKSHLGKTFGGYTNLDWNLNPQEIKGHSKSFIFQLDFNTKHKHVKN
jgi:hypothetical protein